MSESILLTGATGALGSTLLPMLLEKGHRVTCLVRGVKNKSPQDRIFQIVGRHPRLTVIEGDVCKPRCGISSLNQDILKGEIASIFHVAASIAFNDEKLTEFTNINGVQNMLELAEVLDVYEVRHVSTAYIAGDLERFSESDFYCKQRWRNAYENSKYVGEKIIRAWVINPDRQFTIFRPSILVGSEDGSTPTFDAYYTFLYPIYTIAKKMREMCLGGRKVDGIEIQDDWINIPLIMRMSSTSTLNLIPTDWVASTMAELMEIPSKNKTFHLVHPNPQKVLDILKQSLYTLKVCGIKVVEDDELYKRERVSQSRFINRLQKGMEVVHKHYVPYTTGEPNFEMKEPQNMLRKRYKAPPHISEEYLRRLLTYAIGSNWGENISPKQALT